METRRKPYGERRVTIDEFVRLPADLHRDELVGGTVVRESPAGFEHSRVGVTIATRLRNFVAELDLGVVTGSDGGFVLREEPPTVRAPDVAFVARDRLPTEAIDGFAPFAPDLAVEIVSPSDRVADIQEKVLDYLDAGTRMVWVVDPGARTVIVHRSRADIRILRGEDPLDGGDLLPGLRVTVRELFG
ncbi:MAG: Uma2 family endonuclease [Gemmatimonadota bacterium]